LKKKVSARTGGHGYPWIIDEEMLLICTVNVSHIGRRFPEFVPTELPGDRRLEISYESPVKQVFRCDPILAFCHHNSLTRPDKDCKKKND